MATNLNLENTIINDVLCYISTARDALDANFIISTVKSYYDFEKIKEAKDLLCDLSQVKSVRRKKEDKIASEISDVIKLFEEAFINHTELPKFVADTYKSLPPASGFEVISISISRLNDEIDSLQNEIKQFRDFRDTSAKETMNNVDLMNEVADIKKLLLNCEKNANELKISCDSILPDDFLRPPSLFNDAFPAIKGRQSGSYRDASQSNYITQRRKLPDFTS